MAKRKVSTADDMRALGLVMNLETAGQISGIGSSSAYGMARTTRSRQDQRVGRCCGVAVPAKLAHLELG
jgi:hypothetical protein